MAVKGKSKEEIAAAFEARLANDAATEFATALRADQPHRRAAAEGHPALSARASRPRPAAELRRFAAAGGRRRVQLCRGWRAAGRGRPHRRRRRLFAEVAAQAPAGALVDDHSGKLILPGFIDTHIHYPQTRVIGSYGAQLLEWLQKYTFVEEQKFSDPAHAAAVSKFFLDELFRNGTTTAVVYCTVAPESAEAFFAESERRGARMIAGKVMMDRNAPAALTDTPQRGYDESKALIARWHGRGRLDYAITPRFAITSTDAQLEAAGALAREFPDCYVQTHLSENHARDRVLQTTLSGRARLSRHLRSRRAASARNRSSAIASIWKTPRFAASRSGAASPPSARRQICSWARACST